MYRLAHLFAADRNLPAPLDLIVEPDEFSIFNDLTETWSVAGRDRETHAWQIKRQEAPFRSTDIEEILRALHEQPTIDVGWVALQENVEVAGVGSTRLLRNLCDDSRKVGVDLALMRGRRNRGEKKWWRFIATSIAATNDDQVMGLLRRLRVQPFGDEDEVHSRAVERLSTYFDDANHAYDALFQMTDRLDGASKITLVLLKQEILSGLPFRTRSPIISTAPTEARRDYLVSVASREQRRPAFPSLRSIGAPSPVPLAAVFMEPLLELRTAGELPRDLVDTARLNVTEEGKTPDDKPARVTERKTFASWFAQLRGTRKQFVILGEVGSGKSTLLQRLHSEAAAKAELDPGAPIPLLLTARDLAALGAQEAIARALGDARELRKNTDTRWLLLIDALDEVANGWSVVDSVLDEMERHRTLDAAIMTSRPVMLPRTFPNQAVLTLNPWSSEEIDRLFDAWRRFEQGAASNLEETRRHDRTLDELLSNPLTATLSLTLARRERAIPTNRATLFGEVIELLIEDWLSLRPLQSATWDSVAQVVQPLALRMLREQRPSITRDELRSALRNLDPDRVLARSVLAEQDIGILVFRGEDELDFTLRGIAEHLAGRALLAEGEDSVLEAAESAWGEEVVRHAIGVAAARNDVPLANRLHAALLNGLRPPGVDLGDLRRLLIATRCAADLGALLSPQSIPLANALCAYLSEEHSSWIGDRAVVVARRLMRTGGQHSDELVRRLAGLMDSPVGSPARWYAGIKVTNPAAWVTLLLHRDPDVRALAIERLRPLVDQPEIRHLLVQEILDNCYEPALQQPPALAGGLVLRSATRDNDFSQCIRQLKNIMSWGQQLNSGAAAIALAPTEAPVEDLARALQTLGYGFDVPEFIVDELAAAHGADVLDKLWPEWKARRTPRPPVSDQPGERLAKTPPSSMVVRARVTEVLQPILHRLGAEQMKTLIGLTPVTAYQAICEAGLDHPEVVLTQVNFDACAYGHLLPIETQAALGRAAARHESVLKHLLDLWPAISQDERLRMSFPGLALAEPIVKGSANAAHTYAEWLPHSPLLSGLSARKPPPGVLTHPAIISVASSAARRVWEEADRPEAPHLAPSSAAQVMHALGDAWNRDDAMITRVLSWVAKDDPEYFHAGYYLAKDLPLSGNQRTTLSSALGRWIDTFKAGGNERVFGPRVQSWLWWAEEVGITDSVHNSLAEFASERSTLGLTAATILLPSLGAAEAHRVSAALADAGVYANPLLFPFDSLQRLVEAAPESWIRAADAAVTQAPPDPHQIWRLLSALPASVRQRLVAQFTEVALEWELPWLAEDGNDAVRPADRARELCFDLGITISSISPDSDS